MTYLLAYNQTPDERFNSDMNAQTRALIEAHGLEIEGESGGTDLTAGVSDQSFTVKGAVATMLAVQGLLSERLDRQVRLEEVMDSDALRKPRIFTVKMSDVERCPRHSIAPAHYHDDGHCRCAQVCDHCGTRVRWMPGPQGRGWSDVGASDTAIFGSDLLCPKRHGGHQVGGR